MQRKTNDYQIALFLGIAAVVLAIGCKQSDVLKIQLPNTETVQQSLTYPFQYINNSHTTVSRSSMDLDTLWSCAKDYCNRMHIFDQGGVQRYGINPHINYYLHRQHLCAGDLFMEIVNSPSGVEISETPDSLVKWADPNLFEPGTPEFGSFNFDLHDACLPSDSDFVYTTELVLDPLESIDQREEVRRMAYMSYYAAIKAATFFATNPTHRSDLRDYASDSWFDNTDSDNSTGEALVRQMFDSVSTIVNAMKDIKLADASERTGEGVAKGDQWSSQDFGQARALKHLVGNVKCGVDEIQEGSRCWKRCSFGESWDGTQCVGTAEIFNWYEAIEVCKIISKSHHLPIYSEYSSAYSSGIYPGETGRFWTSSYNSSSTAAAFDFDSPLYPYHGDRSELYPIKCKRNLGVPEIDLLPNENDRLPEMTNALQRAIGLLEHHEINFPCFARHGKGDDYSTCTPLKLEENILSRVNGERADFSQTPYSSIAQLVDENSITIDDLHAAAKYMYDHIVLFPRENSYNGPGSPDNTEDAYFTGWSKPFLKIPVDKYVREYQSNYIFYQTGIPTLEPSDNLGHVGLIPMMLKLEKDLEAAETSCDGEDDYCSDAFGDSAEQISDAIGNRNINYSYFECNNPIMKIALTLFNPVDDGEGGTDDEFRIYPIGAHEGPEQFQNMVCLHKDPGCTVQIKTASPMDCDWDPTSSDPSCLWHIDLSGWYEESYFIVETRTTDSSEGDWKVVAVLNNGCTSEPISGEIVTGGLVMNAVKKTLSFNPEDLALQNCDAVASDITGPCIKNDWVPAIDNEVVDPMSDEYEDSYNHYLELAYEAAQNARELRDLLVQDMINEAHEESVEDAEFQQGLNSYIENIRSVCGDNVNEEFEQWANEAFDFTSYTESFADVLETMLNRDYGCEYETDGFSADGNPKKGPVHCAVPRRCSHEEPVSLSDLGVMDDIPETPESGRFSEWISDLVTINELLAEFKEVSQGNLVITDFEETSSNNGPVNPNTGNNNNSFNQTQNISAEMEVTPAQMVLDVCGPYEHYADANEFLDPTGLWASCDGETSVGKCVLDKIWQIRCWAISYRGFIKGIIGNQKIREIPDIFDPPGLEEDPFSQEYLEDGELQTNYGSYYENLRKMASGIDDLKTAAYAYIAAIDDVISLADVIKTKIMLIKIEENKEIALAVLQAISQQMLYQAAMEDNFDECVSGVQDTMDNDYSYSNLVTDIRNLRYEMEKEYNWWDDPDTWHNASDFANYCKSITPNMGDPLEVIGDQICEDIKKRHRTEYLWDDYGNWGPDDEKLIYKCVEDKCRIRENGNDVELLCYDKMAYCDQQWYRIGIDECYYETDLLGSETYAPVGVFYNFGYESDNEGKKLRVCKRPPGKGWYGFSFTEGIITGDFGVANVARKILRNRLYSNCAEQSGCQYDPETYDLIGCSGAASESLQTIVEAWEENGVMWQQIMLAENLQEELEMEGFVQQMVSTGYNLAKAKNDMSSLLRTMASYVAEASRLEALQISHLKTLIADKNLASSASYSNLSEWHSRYDFRLRRYHEQLQRARYLAWVARRAIEFRFGVDLSREVEPTLFGDVPAVWADEIYESYVSNCGFFDEESEDPQEGFADPVDACLAKEDLIEDYVQKLQDYVFSYGNNEWWFHEDDDTGVISMRDHLSNTEMDCSAHTHNVLFFTEELGMDETGAAEIYSSLPNNVSYWTKTADLTIEENVEDLGSPQDVLASHVSNEIGIFADQWEQATAEHLTASAGQSVDAILSQTIDRAEAEDELSPTDGIVPDHYSFSIFSRKAPMSDTCLDGEVFFPSIGRCGITCERDEDSVEPWGTCPDTSINERQVCMNAGESFDTSLGMDREVYMCDWCSADRSCFYQDGQAMAIELELDADSMTSISRKNVNVYPFWTKASVNSLDHVVASQVGTTGNLVANIRNTTTENHVENSEDLTDPVWTGSIDANYYTAPDYTPTADAAVAQSGTSETALIYDAQIDGAVLPKGAFTASFWLRVEDGEEMDQVRASFHAFNDISEGVGSSEAKVTVDDKWQRYQVSLLASEDVRSFKLEFDRNGLLWPDRPSGAVEFGVWGVQIESGYGATPYLPTGKNLIANSSNFTGWWGNVYTEEVQLRAPDGTLGALKLRDQTQDSDIDANYRYKYPPTGDGNILTGEEYTFSVWIRLPDSTTSTFPAAVQIVELDGLGNEIANTTVDHVMFATENWQRISVSKTVINDCASLMVRIMPAYSGNDMGYGSVVVWGPQLERGLVPTGYQKTATDVTDSTVDWGLDVGLVGAQLAAASLYTCDEEGKPIRNYSSCMDHYQTYSNYESECCANVVDWHIPHETIVFDTFYGFYTHCDTCTYCEYNPPLEDCTDPGECIPVAGVCKAESICENNLATLLACVREEEVYQRNTYLRKHFNPICELENPVGGDYPQLEDIVAEPSAALRGQLFKNGFEHVPGYGDTPGYFKYVFRLNMDAIENGAMGQFGVLAPDNFNYRHRTVVINLVGTDVLDCSQAESPATCSANQWVSYDLKQFGRVRIKNHHLEYNVKEFDIPSGHIRGGKAWVAEQVIGYPVSGAHQTALTQLQKVSLMGRPLQGTFELRIYDVPELVWGNVEDIQLVLGYHYWTRSE